MTLRRRLKSRVRERFPGAARRWWHIKHAARDRFPRVINIQRRVFERLSQSHRKQRLVEDWVQTGIRLRETIGLSGVRFEHDGVWIKDRTGAYWSHTLGPFGPVMQWDYRHPHAEGEIELLRRRLKPGSVLIDVGANVGTFSIQLARAVDGLRVLAIEPVPEVCDALRANIAKNGVEEAVETAQLAVSDRCGTAIVTSDLAACNYVVPGEPRGAPPHSQQVVETTLDVLVHEKALGNVDFIKCDVEGMELRVLLGAQSLLERFSPELLLEIEERWTDRYGYGASEIFEFLDKQGYDYRPIIGGELAKRSLDPVVDIGRTNDFLFTPRRGAAHTPPETL